VREGNGAEGGSRTHTTLRSTDLSTFEAIPGDLTNEMTQHLPDLQPVKVMLSFGYAARLNVVIFILFPRGVRNA